MLWRQREAGTAWNPTCPHQLCPHHSSGHHLLAAIPTDIISRWKAARGATGCFEHISSTHLPSSARILTAVGSVAISSRPSPGICGAQTNNNMFNFTYVVQAARLGTALREAAMPMRSLVRSEAGWRLPPITPACLALLYTPASMAFSSVVFPWKPPPQMSVTPRLQKGRCANEGLTMA